MMRTAVAGMWLCLAGLALALAVAGCGQRPHAGGVGDEPSGEVSGAVSGEVSGEVLVEQLRGQQVGTSAAVYFVARNDTGGALELTGVRVLPGTEGATATAAAGLHETIDDNGVLRMRPVESWRLPAGETLELRPGGRHLMVTDLAESEEPDSLQLELRFEAVAVLDTSDLLLTVTVPLGRPGVDLEPHHG